MSDSQTQELRYPIGKFELPDFSDYSIIPNYIEEIIELPIDLSNSISGLKIEDYEKQYREGGWNIREVIHHMAESHTNAYVRFKWALTEEEPTIKPYFEDRCAQLQDYIDMPVQHSVDYLTILHKRLGYLLKSLTTEQFDRKYHHPEWKAPLNIKTTVALYAWHGKHHLAHIELAKKNG